MPSEDDDLTTLTVTIALDDDNGDPRRQENLIPCSASAFSLEKFYVIRPPIRPEHACPLPAKNILVSDLPSATQTLLCDKLNAEQIGSMKNWNYLAAIIGLKGDDIARLKRTDDPMLGVLQAVFDISLARLITAIGEIGRIDVLLSLRPHIHGISANKALLKNHAAQNIAQPAPVSVNHRPQTHAAHNIAPPVAVNHRLQNERFDSAITETVSNFHFPARKFIIVTYHETEKTNKKVVKFLLSALEKVADQCNFDILDIAKCIDETNISQTALELFKEASHIVLFISSLDYKSHISNSSTDSSNVNAVIKLKRLFHCWMDQEYHANGCKNYRFRIILNDTVINTRDVLPIGWPQTTLQYTFPNNAQFKEICTKLFG